MFVSRPEVIHKVGANIDSLDKAVATVPRHQQKSAQGWNLSIRSINLHANRISKLDGRVLKQFSNLVSLNLSGNEISSIESLECCPLLEDLNLSSNRISTAHGLASLVYLRKLQLAYNLISRLGGFMDIHGDHFVLEYLDLKGNDIKELDQLIYLKGLTKLRHLILAGSQSVGKANPFCHPEIYQRSVIFELLPQVLSVDGFDENGNPLTAPAIQYSKFTPPRSQ
ncbi:hypothetical protein BJ742DRAFT_444581 [Cladochytrium replicatum]|nr:hypothetical protein BJ742DRAFT_444581 [Cladochytrium replicatum]